MGEKYINALIFNLHLWGCHRPKKKKWCGKGKKTLDDYKAQQYTWSNYTVK